MRKQLLAVLVAVLATGCTWSQFHGDAARTGFQPYESTIGSSTVASLSEVWTARIGVTASSPVVSGGRVYIGGGGYPNSPGDLKVFDAAGQTNCTGTPKVCGVLWSALTSWSVSATPAVVNGVVYVVDGLGGLSAYDAAGPSHCTVSPALSACCGAPTPGPVREARRPSSAACCTSGTPAVGSRPMTRRGRRTAPRRRRVTILPTVVDREHRQRGLRASRLREARSTRSRRTERCMRTTPPDSRTARAQRRRCASRCGPQRPAAAAHHRSSVATAST